MRNIEKGLLKAFLLCRIQKLFHDLFKTLIRHKFSDDINSVMEHYVMDSKIIRFVIQSILETGEYTLEGISYYTRIPFDVVLDAASGNNKQLTITSWSRIVELYMQVKPDVARILLDRLNELKNDNSMKVMSLLAEI